MLQNFTKYAGLVQTAIGLLGQFVPDVASMLGAAETAGAGNILGGGNLFNVVSGAILSYLGFKGTESAQRTGAQVLGGLNGLVGLLGAFGIQQLGNLQLTSGLGGAIVNLLVGAWGLYSAFAKKTAGAAAH
ncbi:MAG: hypothetical protein ONB48_12210 [candidate division KSB1 bacterium]|nr:hypothetical protein [candidate division KSB1 bacterium]MDZ7274036.1 hypothetical protein [candidate division KSB1 bacterium]MDZ7286409.1 hypothetical protein [candidate division KSB1 bacterium]MDZ7296637.1 hypothetical protein [candidate division KSB1 bacterium]MDZ7306859.1 hypothetical protein [candidate division KSB1 bacterium]